MRAGVALASLLALLGACSEEPGARPPWTGSGTKVWRFQDVTPGQLPPGFRALSGDWTVQTPQGPNPSGAVRPRYLAQHSTSVERPFPLLVVDGQDRLDLDLSVSMMALLPAEVGRGGGLVWRARGPGDHYLAWFDPVERRVGVYVVEGGRRTPLAVTEVSAGQGWHQLRITMKADRIVCYFDRARVLETVDATYLESGSIGLWTMGGALAFFDDLAVRPAE